jgi:hypothetical protein
MRAQLDRGLTLLLTEENAQLARAPAAPAAEETRSPCPLDDANVISLVGPPSVDRTVSGYRRMRKVNIPERSLIIQSENGPGLTHMLLFSACRYPVT